MIYKTFKRIFDLLIASCILLLTLPLILLIMLVLKCKGEGKVFFIQKRIGYRNRNLALIKFTTMFSDSTTKGAGFLTIKNDPRVTPFGSFLRKSKLDELPQLFLVLKGDLSLSLIHISEPTRPY